MKNKNNKQQKPNLFGIHAVKAAWLNPERRFEALYLTMGAQDGFMPVVKEAKSKQLQRPDPQILDKQAFDKLFPHGTVHQGVAARVAPLEDVYLNDIIIEADAQGGNSLVLILDQVTDPHNVGAILRSACAFGAAAVVMQKKHAPEMGGVLAKAASGGLEHIPVIYETNLSRAMEELKKGGFFVYGLDERGEDIGGMKPGGKVALVLGAEGPGMRRLVKENCDALLKIPMNGTVESLNVSNAAAVALYALS